MTAKERKEFIQRTAEYLDERANIAEMDCSTQIDVGIYLGARMAIRMMGYTSEVKDGKHIIY